MRSEQTVCNHVAAESPLYSTYRFTTTDGRIGCNDQNNGSRVYRCKKPGHWGVGLIVLSLGLEIVGVLSSLTRCSVICHPKVLVICTRHLEFPRHFPHFHNPVNNGKATIHEEGGTRWFGVVCVVPSTQNFCHHCGAHPFLSFPGSRGWQ